MSALVVCVLVLFVAPLRGYQLAYEHWVLPISSPVDVTLTAASDGFGFAPDRWRCSGGTNAVLVADVNAQDRSDFVVSGVVSGTNSDVSLGGSLASARLSDSEGGYARAKRLRVCDLDAHSHCDNSTRAVSNTAGER